MFDDVLIESGGKDKRKGGWVTALISGAIHLAIIGAIVAAGMYVKQNPEVIEKPINAFVVQSAPPPPPPPPPPAGSQASAPVHKPVTPEQKPQPKFRQPTETPEDVPEVDETNLQSQASAGGEGGVPGGVEGGVAGGVVGGVVGGTLGGQLGGELGGKLGGQVGGTGDSPIRVGGDVKAPVLVSRIDPLYTDLARRSHLEGVVILEAVIDKNGNVTEARVLKGLGMGLDEQAVGALLRWKFRPGKLNGRPVPVYYNLTINFRLE